MIESIWQGVDHQSEIPDVYLGLFEGFREILLHELDQVEANNKSQQNYRVCECDYLEL